MKYKIDVYTLCYNEEKLAPFVIDYWKKFANHVYIYDNESTDGCLDIFNQYPDWITVIPYNTNDTLNDGKYLEIKNNCWKNSDADFVVVCDFDECIYCKDWDNELDYIKENNISLIQGVYANMITKEFPKYYKTKLFHEKNNMCESFSINNDKVIMFDPKLITEINYDFGAHKCYPKGNIKYYDNNNIWLFHLCNISLNYVLDKRHRNNKRLSDYNRKNMLGIHYTFNDEKIINDFNNQLNNSINIKYIL